MPTKKAPAHKGEQTADRRNVMKLAGAVVAATAGAATVARATDAPATPNGDGYRETAHVLRYYELAR